MPRAADFAAAVREACEVYAKTKRMGEAALVLGKHDIPNFPVDHHNKRPIPRRDPDPTGKLKRGIPGTGGFYKATTDVATIKGWWARNPLALVAVPMGPRSGVWCIDVDTAGPQHKTDGVAEWNALIAGNEPFETREHRSATGGPHVLFAWDDSQPIGCSKGELKDLSLSVKGEGGYIVIPPSVRKGRAYSVFRDIDPIKAPQFLVDLITQGKPPPQRRAKSPHPQQPFDATPQANLDLVAEAMEFIPNDDCPREEWMTWGMRLFAASGGNQRGFEIFDKWSRKSSKYHGGTRQRWDEMTGSPPDHTSVSKIFEVARDNGWLPPLPPAPPTYAIAADPADEARDKMREVVREFLAAVDQPVVKYLGNMPLPPIAHAARVDTGVGKTIIAIEELAAWLKKGPREPVIFSTPRHNLNKPIEQKFFEHGINARIYRGRGADDPLHPGQAMCLNLPAVRLAERCHAEVASSCCKHKKQRCPYFDSCGFQRQLRHRDGVQVWVVATDTLFHEQRALGKEPPCVIIDESAWQQGLRGVDASEEFDWTVAIDSISNKPPPPTTLLNDLSRFRHRLATALNSQPANGGVHRKYLDAQHLDGSACKFALGLEWKLYNDEVAKLGLYPGMPDSRLQAAMNNHALINDIQYARRVIRIWEAARELLNDANIDISGRLTLKRDNGQRVVTWRGISPIKTQFVRPTLLLDATLPDVSVLRAYHERAEVVADIKVELPKSVHVRQVLSTPTSARKMGDAKHLAAIRRHILARYLEFNRPITLVICQQKVEEWLKTNGLPDDIVVEHYNNVTGIDAYRDVRLMLLIGRTQPGPTAVEALTAALTGKCPTPANTRGNGFAWYDDVRCGISLRAGGGVATWGDQHPDPEVEAIRWQICEGELTQAFGRARAINRTAVNPLDADLLFDTCIPVEVDEVITWQVPSLLYETAATDGVMLTSECDLMKCWPHLWPNRRLATRTLAAGVPNLPGFVQVEYQLAGPKMNKRVGYFDRSIVPDPRAWLEARLGQLV
jgi:putative DNA primase/helicase